MMTIKEYVEKIETVVSKQFDLDIDVIKSKSRVQDLETTQASTSGSWTDS